MPNLYNSKDLQDFLEDSPIDWSGVIASRIALRVVPSLFFEAKNSEVGADFLVHGFRANMLAWSSRNIPSQNIETGLEAAATKLYEVHGINIPAFASAYAACQANVHVAEQARGVAAHYSREAALAASDALSDGGQFGRIHYGLLEAINFDVNWLDSRADYQGAARALTRRKLWPTGMPANWMLIWEQAASSSISTESSYANWLFWFARRIVGERSAFDIPGDKRRVEDKAILRRLADATDDEFWDKGEEYVNLTLSGWLEEARLRAAERAKRGKELDEAGARILDELMPNGSSVPSQVAPRLQSAASPQATERDGKLDAGPNKEFDQPRFSGDLADLPSELRSFVRVLSGSLGENASRFMRSSLAEYENEVLVRGNRPILGTLKGLASAIAREVWSAQSLAESDDPEDWQMRDEREWGPGMADMFRTFFRYHRDLIMHFPLDEEREELLRATPIDEMAASGEALTNPVELVTGLIRDLHAQEMATDDILKIVEAHAQYNANIATLPPPELGLPSDYVTPKRRHVLMTAGFYLHLYSVLGSTASLWPVVVANPALATQIQSAAEALLRFIL